jgi:hypothetical protein
MSSLEPTHLVERELNLSLTLSNTQIKLAWFRHDFCVQAIKRLALEWKNGEQSSLLSSSLISFTLSMSPFLVFGDNVIVYCIGAFCFRVCADGVD